MTFLRIIAQTLYRQVAPVYSKNDCCPRPEGCGSHACSTFAKEEGRMQSEAAQVNTKAKGLDLNDKLNALQDFLLRKMPRCRLQVSARVWLRD